ncbi:hypothetical protein BHE74_00023025 [Ensete ventricosum]|nr:hypothetical protein BHE74_00023025 [Ensete ventricosum]
MTPLPYCSLHLTWFACLPGEVIAPLREVETSIGEVRVPLISSIALVVRGMVNLKLVHGLPKMGGGRPSSAAPAPVQPAIVPSSPPEVQEISSEEVTKKVVEASGEQSARAGSDDPLEMHLSPLTHGTRIWQDEADSAKYAQEGKGSMTPEKSHLCGTIALLSLWPYYPLPCICIPFFTIGRSASATLWLSSKSTSFLADALFLGS